MSTAGTIIAGWQKSNIQVILNKTSISTVPSGTATLAFRNVGNGPWPRQNKALRDLGLQSTGGTNSMKIASDRAMASVQRPAFTLDLPFTPTALAFAAISTMQNRTTDTAAVYALPYTDPQAALWFGMETTFGASSGRTVTGAIGKTLKISVPPSGADGGQPTLSLDCIAYSTAQMDALTLTPAILDTAAPCQSTDWNVTYGASGALAAIGHCGFDLSITNNAEVDPQVSVNPTSYALGELAITGSIKVVMSSTAGDEYNTMHDDWLAGTVKEFQFNWGTAGATAYFIIPVLLEEPGEPEKQGNIMVVNVPFVGYYKDADEPKMWFASMATPLTIWA